MNKKRAKEYSGHKKSGRDCGAVKNCSEASEAVAAGWSQHKVNAIDNLIAPLKLTMTVRQRDVICSQLNSKAGR
jgi:hypothetical protein